MAGRIKNKNLITGFTSEIKSGHIFDLNDTTSLKLHIPGLFGKYKTGTLRIESIKVNRYSRKNLTAELVKAIN